MTIENEIKQLARNEYKEREYKDVDGCCMHCFVMGAEYGSTARSAEAKDFAEWIFDEYIESYTTNQEIKTTEQLFDIFKSNP